MYEFIYNHVLLISAVVICFFIFLYFHTIAVLNQKLKKLYEKFGFSDVVEKDDPAFAELKQFTILEKYIFSDDIYIDREPLKRGIYKGYEVDLFECSHEILDETGPNHRQTAVYLKFNSLLPKFVLKPKRAIDILLAPFDIGSEIHPNTKFSKKYLLRGPGKHELQALFDSNVMRFFLQNSKMFVESKGGSLLVYKEDEGIISEDSFIQILDRAIATYELLHK